MASNWQAGFDKFREEASIDRHAFPKLTSIQITELEKFGEYKNIAAGEALWVAGVANVCMFVVRSGVISVRDGRTGMEIVQHQVGGFSGDTDVINGRPSMFSAYAETDIEVLVIAGDCVRAIVSERPEIGELILRTFLLRRNILQQRSDLGVKVIGSRFSVDTLRIREFLARNRYPQSWDDLELAEDTQALLDEFQVTIEETPLVLLPNGKLLKAPTSFELGQALGVTAVLESNVFDLVVVGAGPAGLAAGVYGASEGLNTLMVDAEMPGGQAGTSSRIENYMGFPLGLTGQDLADRAVVQAEKFGAKIVVPAAVEGMTCLAHGAHLLQIEGLGEISTRCVILAPGATYRKLEVDNLAKFENRGVFYAATRIEQLLCSDEPVIVVGGGNSAGQAAVFMSQHVKKVYLVIRAPELRKDMSAYLAKRIELSDLIEVITDSEICSIDGSDHLETAVVANKRTGSKRTVDVVGIFVMIGATPRTEWLPSKIAKDEKGFIITGQDLVKEGKWSEDRSPLFLETSCPGVFAVGDARSNSVKRVASAVGEGSMAVALVHQYMSL